MHHSPTNSDIHITFAITTADLLTSLFSSSSSSFLFKEKKTEQCEVSNGGWRID